jgi:hypothetical protein
MYRILWVSQNSVDGCTEFCTLHVQNYFTKRYRIPKTFSPSSHILVQLVQFIYHYSILQTGIHTEQLC